MDTKTELDKVVEEKKPEVKATVKAPAFDAAEELKKEMAKLPSVNDLEKQIKEAKAKQRELEQLQDLKLNFGPGKPGKKTITLPGLPRGLGEVRINEVTMVGKKELTYDEYRNWESIYEGLLAHERKSRLGEGLVADMELMMMGAGVVKTRITDEQAKF